MNKMLTVSYFIKMVPGAGLELARFSARDFKFFDLDKT